MILGKIVGRCTTTEFEFNVDNPQAKKFDFCQVYHKDYDYVLCQIVELTKTTERIIGNCAVIGYKDEGGAIKQIRSPFDIGTEVLTADEEFIKKVITFQEPKRSAYFGILESTNIPVYLDLNKLLTRHVAVLAKSGAGKSYSVGVLLEEIMDKNVPLVIIDPHSEYSTLKEENNDPKDKANMEKFQIKPKNYYRKVVEYGDTKLNPGVKPLLLNENLTSQELVDMLPAKLTNNQLSLLFSALKNITELNFTNLIYELEKSDNNLKWGVINIIEYLKNLGIFSSTSPTSFNEVVQAGRCSIINLKGIEPHVQEIMVYKLLRDLFMERKQNKIPPFFLVIEEAHNFVPEKGYSEAKSSKVIKTIASEGRKFGLGLCIVSQRPAIVQKTVLSQCTTQIILKVTNPNDLKAISGSVEGITSESEKEIMNLPIGTALVTGVAEMPLFVNVRPRKTKHGGHAVDMLGLSDDRFFDELKEYRNQGLLPVIMPKINLPDLRIMHGPEKKILTVLVPCVLFACNSRKQEFNLLVEMVEGTVVQDIEASQVKSAHLPELDKLGKDELRLLETAFKLKQFDMAELIKASGQALDADMLLKNLVEKGYVVLSGPARYEISDKYILSNLSKHAFFGKIEFLNIPFDRMIEKVQRLDSVKARLSKFTAIKDLRECYLVHYVVE
ncbi:MAG: ATP-binding protein [Candidatus Woesearchaeota archaeon]